MEKEWAKYERNTVIYKLGARKFVDNVQESMGNPERIRCPCKKCICFEPHNFNVVYDHLICYGIDPLYTNWTWHGDEPRLPNENLEMPETYRMFHDAFLEDNDSFSEDDNSREPREEIEESDFGELLEEAEHPLYEGSSFSKMSATVAMYKFKARHGLSDVGFDDLADLIREFLPDDNTLPSSLYNAKKLLNAFDLGYEKIHACVRDCCLFRKDLEHEDKCPKCDSSRWKVDESTGKIQEGVPAKVLRYFPIKDRFRRMFKSVEKAEQLRWHHTNKSQDGMMRHPVDSLAWKHIDSNWPSFASDPRNLRLGLSTDGFSSRYSVWPVILVTYNLPPSLCMSKENLMLTLLIPGPKQPGNDIDVYLKPLIEDLTDLWVDGIRVYDAFMKSTFTLKAILMWNMHDLPAYGNLSGYSTKGRKACPVCGVQTNSQWLKNGKKHSYMCHRTFLPHDHPFRSKASWFDGTEEHRDKPRQLTGSEVFEVVKDIENIWGKKIKKEKKKKLMRKKKKEGETRKKKKKKKKKKKEGETRKRKKEGETRKRKRESDSDSDGDDPFKLTKRWKKKSIFFDLPYWEYLLLRHLLDIMHIEKNICESIIGTLLEMKGKSKDTLNSRKDLQELGIGKKLLRKKDGASGSKRIVPPYVLLKKEKSIFCRRLFNLRMPDGYCSNISSRVLLEKNQILNLKSHDCHVLMQQLLSVALRGLLPKGPRVAIFRLCASFNLLCQRVVDIQKVEQLDKELPETLCMLERFFPPSFFDVMVHLTIHLAQQVLITGPVQFCWMFPFERYMKVLTDYVRKRSNPEGCIAENYLAEEITRFCGGYITEAAKLGSHPKRNEDYVDENIIEGKPFGQKKPRQLTRTMWESAHRYVLTNTTELDPWKELHKEELKLIDKRLKKNKSLLQAKHQETFSDWLAEKVRTSNCGDMSETIRWIACKPKREVLSCSGYLIKGNRFHTRESEKGTQNSGVSVEADTYCRASARDTRLKLDRVVYYGVIKEIILLDRQQSCRRRWQKSSETVLT